MDNNVNNDINSQDSPFATSDELYGKKLTPVPKPKRDIGIDLDSQVMKNVVDTYLTSLFDMSLLESFSRVALDRESIYQLLDSMTEDSMIASVLEIYAEDSTEPNDRGQIVWVESDDPDVDKYVSYLLDSMNIDKNIYSWSYSLCKYGDLYLRLFHESDIEDGLFDSTKKETLNEDIILKAYNKKDKLVHYVEAVSNPAEIFELTKFGKSYAYIEAPVRANLISLESQLTLHTYKYAFKKNDIYVYLPTEFVHAVLEDNSSRIPEEVEIFNDENDINSSAKLSYKVKRGQSLLYNSFKIWREMMLLENSMLLNRLTKSSIVRVVNVEVGDMPKEQIGPHLMGIKLLMELKASINEGISLREYTNPGPIENNIYVPVRNGLGSISTQEIGGNVDVKGLSDVDYFKNRLYASLRVPKMFLGDTDDGAGFNGGTSLSIISSRYAKAIKRILNTLIQAITDAVNIMLLNKGLDSYINKFKIRMQEPTTQEEMDRRNNLSTKIQSASDVLALTGDIQDPLSRLKLLKNLIAPIVNNSDIMQIIEEEIEKLTIPENGQGADLQDMDIESDGGFDPSSVSGGGMSMPSPDINVNIDNGNDNSGSADTEMQSEVPEQPAGELPSPEALGAGDFTDNNMEV